MLLVHRDIYGWITACIDYQVVDEAGKTNYMGNYIWVEQLEVSHGIDAKPHIQQFIQEIADLQPNTLGAYWERRDRPGRKPLWFSRERLLTFARRDGQCVAA